MQQFVVAALGLLALIGVFIEIRPGPPPQSAMVLEKATTSDKRAFVTVPGQVESSFSIDKDEYPYLYVFAEGSQEPVASGWRSPGRVVIRYATSMQTGRYVAGGIACAEVVGTASDKTWLALEWQRSTDSLFVTNLGLGRISALLCQKPLEEYSAPQRQGGYIH